MKRILLLLATTIAAFVANSQYRTEYSDYADMIDEYVKANAEYEKDKTHVLRNGTFKVRKERKLEPLKYEPNDENNTFSEIISRDTVVLSIDTSYGRIIQHTQINTVNKRTTQRPVYTVQTIFPTIINCTVIEYSEMGKNVVPYEFIYDNGRLFRKEDGVTLLYTHKHEESYIIGDGEIYKNRFPYYYLSFSYNGTTYIETINEKLHKVDKQLDDYVTVRVDTISYSHKEDNTIGHVDVEKKEYNYIKESNYTIEKNRTNLPIWIGVTIPLLTLFIML